MITPIVPLLLPLATLSPFALLEPRAAPCQPLSASNVPVPSPNTPEGFSSFAIYNATAQAASEPHAYERFLVGGDAAVKNEGAYLGYITLSGYDVGACAAACDGMEECAAFNIYFQRSPSLVPGPECPNPTAAVEVRCALFSTPMSAIQATNEGQLRGPADEAGERFQVLVAGSNGYNRLLSPSEKVVVTQWVTVAPTQTVTKTVSVTETVRVA